AALLLAVVPLARIVVPLVDADFAAELLGPFRAAAYLQSYFLLILPNALVASALMFALATLLRHTLGSYIVAALVFIGSQGSAGVLGGVLGRWELAKLVDSTGITALNVMTQTWSPVDLNTRLVASEGALLWNRLVWLTLAFAALAFTYTRFRYGGTERARWWRRFLPAARSAQRGARAGDRAVPAMGMA